MHNRSRLFTQIRSLGESLGVIGVTASIIGATSFWQQRDRERERQRVQSENPGCEVRWVPTGNSYLRAAYGGRGVVRVNEMAWRPVIPLSEESPQNRILMRR